ncbi:MAG: hypothetical protein HY300_11060 [Verrucomicrobia bacterium]|nr:hypothetical protein [Verrucomicrobiota bacterium]
MTPEQMSPEQREALLRDHPLLKGIKPYRVSTAEFLERIKSRATPAALQEWATGILRAYPKAAVLDDVPEAAVPRFVRELDPPIAPRVLVVPDSHVMVDWGGGWGHWGLAVGPTNYKSDAELLFTIEWAPGIFAYHTKH